MKKVFLILSFCLIAFHVNAQNFIVDKGLEFEGHDGSRFYHYIDSDSSGVYLERFIPQRRGYTEIIQRLDPHTLKTIYSQNFSFPEKVNSEGKYLQNGKIFDFTTDYVKSESTDYLILHAYDANTGKRPGGPLKIASVKGEPSGADNHNFYISFSPDQRKMLITSEVKVPKKQSEVSCEVYETSTLKKLATLSVINGYAGSTISSFNYKVDNNGKLYYLFKYMKDFEEEIAGMALASLASADEKTSVTPLPFDKLDIKNGTFEFVNNNLVFCGVFKDVVTKKEKKQGKEGNVGVYSFFIDINQGTISRKGFDYFTKEVRDKLTYSWDVVKKNPEQKHYSFEKILAFNDAVYLIESHSFTIFKGAQYWDFEKEFIVSKFDSGGKMEWMRIIPKFTQDKLNSFNYVVKNNKVYLFYAEHPKNLEKWTVTDYDPQKYNQISNYNGSVLVCTSFDEKGNLSRKSLFRNEGWCYDPDPANIVLPDSKLLLRMINHGKERYDRVTIED
jgi:hypothetical protein